MTREGNEHIKEGSENFETSEREALKKLLRLEGASKILYTSKPTHDIIIQIGW